MAAFLGGIPAFRPPFDRLHLEVYKLVNQPNNPPEKWLPDLSCTDLENVIIEKLPLIDHNNEVAEHVSKTAIRIRMPFRPEYMGRDIWQDSGHGVFSGPKVMGLADTSMYVCMHAALGKDVVAVLSNLAITFLRPALAKDLVAEAKIIRIGRRLAYLETYLFSDGSADPVAHATSSFAYRFAPATP